MKVSRKFNLLNH